MTNRSEIWLEAVNRLKPKKRKLTGGNALFSSTPTYLSILQMSYAPGTLLSIGAGATLEQVLVLSDGRVATKLFGGKSVVQRDILSLSDWLMLADGDDIIVTSRSPQLPPSPVSEPMNSPVAAPVAAPEPLETYPMGTRLRWSKDEKNRRTAIIIKDGVLQVKEVIDDNITMIHDKPEAYYKSVKKTFFNNVAEWKASLPEGGTVATFSGPQIASIEEKAKKPIEATTDCGYIAELTKRYLVRSDLHQQSSINQNIERTRKYLNEEVQRFARNISLDNSNIERVITSSNYINYQAKWLQRQILEARGKTFEELDEITHTFHNYYKQKLFAYKGGLKYEICSKANMIALAPSAEGTRYRGKALVGKSFADLGIEMKSDGKPRLEVSYYRRRIEL